MILFAISFLFVFASSYLIVSLISPRRSVLGLIYLFLTAFAQVVFTFELLSLFSAIKQFWVLGVNVLFLAASLYFWNKKGKPVWGFDFLGFRNKFINALKFDKALAWLYVGFCVFILSALFLCFIMPITNADAQAYHVARSVFYVLQGSLNHFQVSDIRDLCLPINSEILYSWVLLFVKKDVFLGFFSFSGYLLAIISIYNILGLVGYCVRKRLWVIFTLSAFSSVLVQASGTETDIIIAGLIASSIFLFWYALKNEEKIPIFMSALAYSLAIGTKTTAIIAIPGTGLFLLFLCYRFKKYKPLGYFIGFGLLNFLIFSSYNYILNFIDFGNFMGSESFFPVSKNYYGIKGMVANFIRYIFMFFDFTGFTWGKYFAKPLTETLGSILSYLHLDYVPNGLYNISPKFHYDGSLLEPVMGAGILGLFLFLPCFMWAMLKPVFNPKSKRALMIFAFAVLFIINILSLSYVLVYMSYSIRFVMTFIVLSSPILVYSYCKRKNFLKPIIVFFAMFYLVLVSTHLWPRPFVFIVRILEDHPSITYLREVALCKEYSAHPQYSNSICPLIEKIRKTQKGTKILAFCDGSDNIYLFKALEFEGYKVDFRNLEDIKGIDFSKYNLVIIRDKGQISTVIKKYAGKNHTYGDISCSYLHNARTLNKLGNKSFPFQVTCAVSSNFLDLNHLTIMGTAGVLKPYLNELSYYYIYRNTELPLKFKKAYTRP